MQYLECFLCIQYTLRPLNKLKLEAKALLPAYSFFPIHDVQEPLSHKTTEKKEVTISDFLLLASQTK